MPYPYRYAPGAEVFGGWTTAIFNNLYRDEIPASANKFGIDTLDPEQWYPANHFIELFKAWYAAPNATSNLVSVGMAIIYHIDLPETVETLDPVGKLMRLGDLHMAQHRCGDAGEYIVERLDERAIRYKENTVWPDELIYGYIYGAARHFFPHGTHFTLRFPDNHQRQDEGGTSTILDLVW